MSYPPAPAVPLQSDESFETANPLRLPTSDVEGRRLSKRQTLVVSVVIEHIFYPVFPPDSHPEQVLT